MKVLLIAYACEPNKGSEPGVGWNWAVHLSKYVNVTVVTRANNKEVIEHETRKKTYSNLSFIYYDIPIISKIKKKLPLGTQLYYLLWEYFVIKKNKNYNHDVVQKITFVSTASILRLYKLNKPYIMSFCAGGESTPISIYCKYSFLTRLKEKMRVVYNSAYRYCPITKELFNKSKQVIAVTDETKEFLQKNGYKGNIIVEPAIGIEDNSTPVIKEKKYKLIYAGSLIYLKNIDILINGIIRSRNQNLQFDIYGNGSEKNKLQNIVSYSDCKNNISFYEPIERGQLLNKMCEYDIALHASSHDSGSMFLLEAISCGIPVLFLNTGGPKEIFKGIDYPLKVDPTKSYEEIIKSFTERINWFYANYDSFTDEFALVREKILEKYSWDNKAKRMVELYKEILNENSASS